MGRKGFCMTWKGKAENIHEFKIFPHVGVKSIHWQLMKINDG